MTCLLGCVWCALIYVCVCCALVFVCRYACTLLSDYFVCKRVRCNLSTHLGSASFGGVPQIVKAARGITTRLGSYSACCVICLLASPPAWLCVGCHRDLRTVRRGSSTHLTADYPLCKHLVHTWGPCVRVAWPACFGAVPQNFKDSEWRWGSCPSRGCNNRHSWA